MHPVNRILLTAFGVVALAFLAKNTWAAGGARTIGGKGTAESLTTIRVEGVQVSENYLTLHAPHPGQLQQLGFHTSAAGAGAGFIRFGVVRDLADGGVESLCDVNVPCTGGTGTHVHPDAGTCNNAEIADGEHLRFSPVTNDCALPPDGTAVLTFLWE